MADDKGLSEKIISDPISDPIFNSLNDLGDVNPHLVKEIKHFFQVYKDLENKKVDTKDCFFVVLVGNYFFYKE